MSPKYYGSGMIGLDVKPRKKASRISRNRYMPQYSRWLFPLILSLATVGIMALAGTR